MTVDRKHWVTRLYLYGLDLIRDFTETPQWRFKEKTNLCHFMRVILIWIPVIWLARAAVLVFTGWILFVYPVRLFGGSYWLKFLVAVALAGWFGYGVKWFYRHLSWIRVEKTSPRSESTSVRLVKEFLKAKKAKICPVLEIGDHSDV